MDHTDPTLDAKVIARARLVFGGIAGVGILVLALGAMAILLLPSRTPPALVPPQKETLSHVVIHPEASTFPILKDAARIANAHLATTTTGLTLVVDGTLPGTWYFEASFPATLTLTQGAPIQVPAQATSDWMTESPVPFHVVFPLPSSAEHDGVRGTLTLKKDNPSGMVEHDAQIEIALVLPALPQ